MSNSLFSIVTGKDAYPCILTTIKDETNNREYELEITLSWNGVTVRLPNQTDEEDDKSIVVDVWDNELCVYIFDNAEDQEPYKVVLIPKLNHAVEVNRIVAHNIVKNTPYGKIQEVSKDEKEERLTRVQLLSLVKTLRKRIDELETSEVLLKELQEDSPTEG